MTLPAVITLAAFVRSIAILAMDARTQIEWLNSLGLPGRAALADELALEFDDGYMLLPVFLDKGWLKDHSADVLGDIARALTAMSGRENEAVWAVEALASDPRWEEVRGLARKALAMVA